MVRRRSSASPSLRRWSRSIGSSPPSPTASSWSSGTYWQASGNWTCRLHTRPYSRVLPVTTPIRPGSPLSRTRVPGSTTLRSRFDVVMLASEGPVGRDPDGRNSRRRRSYASERPRSVGRRRQRAPTSPGARETAPSPPSVDSACGAAVPWRPGRVGRWWPDGGGQGFQAALAPACSCLVARTILGSPSLILDWHDQVGVREEQEVALCLSWPQWRSGCIQVDDDVWMWCVCQRSIAFALLDGVDETGSILDPGTNRLREAIHSVSPLGSEISTHSLCSAVATLPNPDG